MSSHSIDDVEERPAHKFTNIQPGFSFTRRARPPPIHVPTGNGDDGRIPLRQPKISRRDSKGGLRGIFTRNKPEKIAISPVLEESDVLARGAVSAHTNPSHNTSSRRIQISQPLPEVPATPRPISRPSRMNLRSKSVKQPSYPARTSLDTKSSAKSPPQAPRRASATWDPPPLFQAYPQSVKHAQLSASKLSADSILRLSNHKRNHSLRDEIAQTQGDGEKQSEKTKKAEKGKSKHRRQLSGSISKSEWTQKIYVLVTSGYLLQYSGDGSFDRLPEKMMQLGKDSVAFASDAIPGKHWVLQISQAMDADGTPAADPRSLLSRLTFRGADYRRTATSFLLVLNSAEEMDHWLATVRREIESLGGKKHVSETGKARADEKIMQLRSQASRRSLIKKNEQQNVSPPPPQSPIFTAPPSIHVEDSQPDQKLEDTASNYERPPTGRQSITNSVASLDGTQLDSLRNSSNRFSYMSSGQRTLITSQGSTPATSPVRESYHSIEEVPLEVTIEESRLRPNASAISERRRSMQTILLPSLEVQQTPKNFRHSTYVSRPPRSTSPTPSNFSVPIPFSKRSSSIRGTTPEAPPPPTKSRSRDSSLKGVRKAPPTALGLTRPLSPVKDSSSPGIPPTVASEQSNIYQIVPSIFNITPQSPEYAMPANGEPSPLSPNFSRNMNDYPEKHAETPACSISRPSSVRHQSEDLDPTKESKYPSRSLESPPPKFNDVARYPDLPFSNPPPPPTISSPLYSRLSEFQFSTPPKESHRGYPSQLPILTDRNNLRRPASVQVRVPPSPIQSESSPIYSSSTNPYPGRSSSIPSPPANRSLPNLPPSISPRSLAQSSFTAPPLPFGTSHPAGATRIERLKEENKTALLIRRSMPVLINGPPPAPPPNYALPPLPPPGEGMRGTIGSRSSRGSVRI